MCFSVFRFTAAVFFLSVFISGAADIALEVDAAHPGPAIDLTRFALGQGGLSDQAMFDAHVEQIAQPHPQTIRIFVQEYFDLYPKRHRYHWATLDKVIETVLATKAKPLLCLSFKPKTLYPKVDQSIVHPASYQEWDELIYRLVRIAITRKNMASNIGR